MNTTSTRGEGSGHLLQFSMFSEVWKCGSQQQGLTTRLYSVTISSLWCSRFSMGPLCPVTQPIPVIRGFIWWHSMSSFTIDFFPFLRMFWDSSMLLHVPVCLLFETVSYWIVYDGLESPSPLSQPPEVWDNRCLPPQSHKSYSSALIGSDSLLSWPIMFYIHSLVSDHLDTSYMGGGFIYS